MTLADLNALNLEINASASNATSGINKTINSLARLQQALSSFGNKGNIAALKNLGSTFKEISSAVNSVSSETAGKLKTISSSLSGLGKAMGVLQNVKPESLENLPGIIDQVASAVERLTPEALSRMQTLSDAIKSLNTAGKINFSSLEQGLTGVSNAAGGGRSGSGKSIFSALGKGATTVFKGLGGAVKSLGNDFARSISPLSNFGTQLLRVAKMRFMRSIVKGIGSGAISGLKNLAAASSEAKSVMTQLSSAGQSLSNALGGALFSALSSVIGMVNSITSALMTAINAISALFAALGGKLTFKQATQSTKEFGEAAGGAAGSASALKQELMAFDEINSLSPDSGGGGGGGGGSSLGNVTAMFEQGNVPQILTDAVKKADFSEVGRVVAQKLNQTLAKIPWGQIQLKGERFGKMLGTFITGFVDYVNPLQIGRAIAGVINTGLKFVNAFYNNTDWKLIGIRIKQSIGESITRINPAEVGEFLVRKLKAAIGLLTGLLEGVNWAKGADWIIGVIQGAADSVTTADLVGCVDAIGSAISGMMTSISLIANSEAIQSIAKKVSAVVRAGIRWAGTLLAQAGNVVLDIGSSLVDALNDCLEDPETINSISQAITDFFKTFDWQGVIDLTLNIGRAIVNLGFDLAAGIAKAVASALGIPEDQVDEATHKIKMSWDTVMQMSFSPDNNVGGKDVTGALEKDGWFGSNRKLTLTIDTEEVGIEASQKDLRELDTYAHNAGLSINGAVKELAGFSVLGDADDWMTRLAKSIQAAEVQAGALNVDVDLLNDVLSVIGAEGGEGGIAEARVLLSECGATYSTIAAYLASSGDSLDGFSTQFGLTADEIQLIRQAIDQLNAQGFTIDTTTANDSVQSVVSAIDNAQTAVDDLSGSSATPEVDANAVSTNTAKVEGSFNGLTSTISASGDAADEVKTKIVEIPTEKEININLRNSSDVLKKLNTIKGALSSLSNKSINMKVKAGLTAGAKSFLKSLEKIDSSMSTAINDVINASQFASGGFPRRGDLFWANEAGSAEMVGSIGGRTAVANQAEIGDAIFRYMDAYGGTNGGVNETALASAIVNGLQTAGIGTVYLDGRMLANSINRETARSGRSAIKF